MLVSIAVTVQSLNHVWFFVIPWTAAHQASLSFTISQCLIRFMSTESMKLTNHLILYSTAKWISYTYIYVQMLSSSVVSLCDSMDCSPPGSSVHGIFQARILEWVAISSSRGSLRPRDWTCVSYISCIGRQILYHWATWEAHVYIHPLFFGFLSHLGPHRALSRAPWATQ